MERLPKTKKEVLELEIKKAHDKLDKLEGLM